MMDETPIIGRSNSMISTAQSMVNKDQSLIVAAPVTIRGRRLRQILHVLPIDVMEVQMLAREFFARCDLQEKYQSLDKCAETFGISSKIAQGVYSYIRTNDVLDDVPFNYARKLALLYPLNSGRSSVIEDLQEWSRIYGETQSVGTHNGLHLHTPRKSMLQLPKLYLTFENFVECAVYLSPRASMQQRIDLAFSIFDANGDGFVDAQEIKSVMLDSLNANLRHNNNDDSATTKNVENMFKNEVEELINDLKLQYRSDEFCKEEFIEFARGVEFLNCFTVNKHWLRDILGDNKDNTRYARPQDAEMKQFLESICEEHESIDSEQIIDLQEKLRDHLIDTVDDLKTINNKKYYHKMNINRRISDAICKKIKIIKNEQDDDEYQELISGINVGVTSTTNGSMLDPNDISNALGINNNTQEIQINMKIKTYLNHLYHSISIEKLMEFCFIILFCIQIIISYFVITTTNIFEVLGQISSVGLYLCLFIAPLSRYYPFITKWISLTTNSNIANIILYCTSRESEKINTIFAICFAFIHIISYHSYYNTYSLFPISGLIMIIFGIILLTIWYKIRYKNKNINDIMNRNNHKFNHYTKINAILSIFVKLTFVLSFIFHSVSVGNKSYSDHILLYISLFPTVLILILTNFEYILGSKRMEVELARNERPNYVLLSIKKNQKNQIQWKCGQYVEINCPTISKWEYHPFYITSSPDSNYMDIAILSCGDWTQKLWELYVSENNELFDLKICGPYGIGFAPNKMNYNFDYLLIVATGNGSVEMIASLLNFVCTNFLSNPKHPINKIYCYWMVSADDGCYWFYKLLRDLRHIYIDQFIPCIFVTSTNHDDKANAFGLNFFLALRRESLQTNLVTQQIRLSAGRISTLRRPVSIFTPNQRASRFHQPNTKNLLGSFNKPEINKNKNKNNLDANDSKHGIEINNLDGNDEDIPMQSPDFRYSFNKIREELLQNYGNKSHGTSPASHLKHKVQSNNNVVLKQQNSMHGIVPALVVATSNSVASRTYQVGTFFVGSELLEHRLKYLCQQFTDDQVIFEFNSMVTGNNYERRYST